MATDIDTVITNSEGIRDETADDANTATRVGTNLVDLGENIKERGMHYGTMTNANILLISSPSEGDTADSSDDLTRCFYISGAWRNVAGGLLS